MNVNRFKIRFDTISSGTTINVPISMDFTPVDNTELIENDFIVKEKEKSINPIIDYERERYNPINDNSDIIDNINITVHFKLGNNYGDIGFINDDIRFRKNNFKNSFIRLNFYDSPIPSNQELMLSMVIFTQLGVNQRDISNKVKDVNNLPISFKITNPNKISDDFGEGYHIYWYKDIESIQELYMSASFNNAKDGKITNLIPFNGVINFKDLFNDLFLKYNLFKNNNDYLYSIEKTPNQTVTIGVTDIDIDLYEIDVN